MMQTSALQPSEKKKKKKRPRILKPRHMVLAILGFLPLVAYCKLVYHARIVPFSNPQKRNFLVLHNHVTPGDELFIHVMLRRNMVFMATEDIFSCGWISRLLEYALALIPIDKTAIDVGAIKKCYQAAKEKAHIVIAPEGNRTYSGKTEYIKPSIVSLARALKIPVLLIKIEGGYGVNPRWSDNMRLGRMKIYASDVIEPEEYAALSDEDFYARILNGIEVNAATDTAAFLGNKRAEYLERAFYYCPDCGFTRWQSHGNTARCLSCNRTVRYGEDMTLTGVDRPFPFAKMNDWYEAQSKALGKLDISVRQDTPYYTDTVQLFSVQPYKRKHKLVDRAGLQLFGDRLYLTADGKETCYLFSDLRRLAVLGHNKLNIRTQAGILQCKGDKRFNALKYVQFYYHFLGKTLGDGKTEFLGL